MLKLREIVKKKKVKIINIILISFISISMVVLWNEKEQTTVSKININKPKEYSASSTVNDLKWSYKVDNEGNAIGVHCETNELPETVKIPSVLEGHKVIELKNTYAKSIFNNTLSEENTTVKNVIIPEGVKTIGSGAFYNCRGLTGELKIPEGVTTIGNSAFEGCRGLTGNLIIPESVTSLGEFAFSGCSGFSGNLIIPKCVTSIGEYAFSGCSGFTGNLIIPESVTSIGRYAFYNCSGLTGNLIIPKSVTSIGEYAFSGCSGFTGNLIIPEDVTSIGDGAFYNCRGLNGALVIPDGMTSIGEKTFFGCSGLTGNLIIPENVASIGEGAFEGCSGFIENLIIPKSVESIGNRAFERCSGLTGNLIIPENVTSIGDGAFYWCSGFSGRLEIPDSVTSIGKGAFEGCSGFIGNLIIPKSVTSIAERAFFGCSGLTGNLIIPEDVTSIGNGAFCRCSSFSGRLEIPDSVTSIGNFAFKECRGLTGNLIIPESVTSIGYEAFEECSDLTGNLVIPKSVTSIAESAFCRCSGFTGNLIIPESVTSIGEYAFLECSGLTGNLIIPESVTSIGKLAFRGCRGLTGNLIIPESVISIGEYAFYACSSFTGNFVIGNNVTSIEDRAFLECRLIIPVVDNGESIQEIELPDVIKRARVDGDILYSDREFVLNKCELSDDGTKLKVNVKDIVNTSASLKVNAGKLNGLTVLLVPSGTITYNITDLEWSKKSVIATLHIADGERIINNDGNNAYIFTENGEYTFKYLDINNEEKEVIAGTKKIDKTIPVIKSVEGNATEWTKNKVTLKVNAEDNLSGFGYTSYSFDGGKTWQQSNEKTYTENTNNIVIKVRDKAGNEVEYEAISITKIDKTAPKIKGVEGNLTQWTKDNVTLKVNAEDNLSGLAEKAYSFDGGKTWQSSNVNTYTENTEEIVIKVKDNLGNISEYNPLSITNIDKTEPTIKNVEGNPTEWTKEDVTLKINAEDNLSGLAEKAYSFDGGKTWQQSNERTYTENINNIVIKVKDKAGNEIEYEPLSINKIIKLTSIKVKQEPGKKTYIEGQNFESTGMKIEAIYNNGTTEEISNYQVTNGNNLKLGQTGVTISYTEDGVTKTIGQDIRVIEKLKLEVTKENGKEYIENIKPNTSIETIKVNMETKGTIEIYRENQKIVNESQLIGTGMEIIIKLDNEEKRYTVVVTGDLTGNGKMGIGDLSKLSRYTAGLDKTLSGAYLKATDILRNGKYGGIANISKMSRILAGMDNL